MTAASFALQSALYAALVSDTGVTALIGANRIYDDVPARAAFPYVVFSTTSARDWSTASDFGHEHIVTLHVWSRAAGRKEAAAVLSAIESALHDRALTLDGHRLVNLRHEFSECRRDGDGETVHGITRYRAVTEVV